MFRDCDRLVDKSLECSRHYESCALLLIESGYKDGYMQHSYNYKCIPSYYCGIKLQTKGYKVNSEKYQQKIEEITCDMPRCKVN